MLNEPEETAPELTCVGGCLILIAVCIGFSMLISVIPIAISAVDTVGKNFRESNASWRSSGKKTGANAGIQARLNRERDMAYWEEMSLSTKVKTRPFYCLTYGIVAFVSGFLFQYVGAYALRALGVFPDVDMVYLLNQEDSE